MSNTESNTESKTPNRPAGSRDTSFVCTQALHDHMVRTGRRAICLEVATSNTSDIEITEPFLRLAREELAVYLKEKKKYRVREALCPDGSRVEVLLMPYNLQFDRTVTFDRKRVLCFHKLSMEGVRI